MLIGIRLRMYPIDVPLLHHETKTCIYHAPVASSGDFFECPTCIDAFPCSWMEKNRRFPSRTQRKVGHVSNKLDRANHSIPLVMEVDSSMPDTDEDVPAPARDVESDDEYYMCQDTLLLDMLDDTLDLSVEGDEVSPVSELDRSINYYVESKPALKRQLKAVVKKKPVQPRQRLTKGIPEDSRLWDPCCWKTNVSEPPT